jgi:hypothetical protein
MTYIKTIELDWLDAVNGQTAAQAIEYLQTLDPATVLWSESDAYEGTPCWGEIPVQETPVQEAERLLAKIEADVQTYLAWQLSGRLVTSVDASLEKLRARRDELRSRLDCLKGAA